MPGDFDLVKERVDIVQVIGEHVPLKKAGRIYKALCPFHTEKTPSFTVDPDRRTYKCFGCSEFGDVFTFLEKREGLTSAEALERLAERAGVEIRRRSPEEREQNARLLAAHETAYFYFRQALRGTPGGAAVLRYLEGRGLRRDTIEKFGLGYAPNLREGLLAYLRKKGFSDEEAVQSGLIVRTEKGDLLDRFRDRLMVPIRDGRGRAIAFGGRALGREQAPKYMNSPATPLFDKSRTLYALDVARPAIRKAKEAVVVEGYFDAISAHQAEIANVVASMGTALTPQQYELLRPVAEERAVIAFDADPAGLKAAESRGRDLLTLAARMVFRGRSLATSAALDLRVALMPEGLDPDQLVRRDPEAFREVVAAAKPVAEFLLDLFETRVDLATQGGRQTYAREALPILAELTDPVERDSYVKRVADRTGVREEVLRGELRRPSGSPTIGQPAAAPEPAGKERASAERYLVAQLVRFPEQARHLELSAADFSDPSLRALFERLLAGERRDQLAEPLRLAAVELLADVPEPASAEDLVTALGQAALRVRAQSLKRLLQEAEMTYRRSESDADLAGVVDRLTGELAGVMAAQQQHTVLERVSAEEE